MDQQVKVKFLADFASYTAGDQIIVAADKAKVLQDKRIAIVVAPAVQPQAEVAAAKAKGKGSLAGASVVEK